jgi:lipopolysaccharide/colanic/teichoic acid biosynthesis glycosyltransferase
MKKRLLIIDDNEMILGLMNHCYHSIFELHLCQSLKQAQELLASGLLPDVIITDLNLPNEDGKNFIQVIKSNPRYTQIPLIVLSGEEKSQSRIDCLKLGADDYVVKPFHPDELQLRIEKQITYFAKKNEHSDLEIALEDTETSVAIEKKIPSPKSSLRKRLFDILVASLALIILLPLLILVAILIKIDSKGPILFLSKRIGAGYQVFDLYKFRTMRMGAEKEINNLAHLNMYHTHHQDVKYDLESQLIDDSGWKNEDDLLHEQHNQSAFLKFKNDPRITKLGTFLRNTSIDELPQLINIIKGDMSLVGNRPLPLYEAEKLTKDESAARFLAPAGLTGLWQVTKRGKGEVSAEERQKLDNIYTFRHNWKFDLTLIARTVVSLFQSEKM